MNEQRVIGVARIGGHGLGGSVREFVGIAHDEVFKGVFAALADGSGRSLLLFRLFLRRFHHHVKVKSHHFFKALGQQRQKFFVDDLAAEGVVRQMNGLPVKIFQLQGFKPNGINGFGRVRFDLPLDVIP